MARTLRSRTLATTPEQAWELVADPLHLPRWWPGVLRVEDVSAVGFTQVMRSKRGRPVRLDQRVVESFAPRRRSWSQQLGGTPFERLLSEWTTIITLESAGPSSTLVTIAEEQDLKGSFRLGAPLQVRPARHRLDSALAALAGILER